MRIIFAGTPEFAVAGLDALIEHRLTPTAVYTQPDRPAGRGRKLTASPVKRRALEAGIPVYQPASLKRRAAIDELAGLEPDLMVVIAYGLLLPPAVLAIPRLGCINIHASLLPRWRGAAPIQHALLAGDEASGVCVMRMEAGLDTGPVYLAKTLPISPRETGGHLHDKLAALGAEALIEALPGIADGSSRPTPQDDARATYASKLSKEAAVVDWSRPAAEIDRMIRAFDPWPVAETCLGESKLRLWACDAPTQGAAGAAPGQVLAANRSGIEVATGAGAIRITRLQLAGKRPQAAADFVNAYDLKGARLGCHPA